MNQHVKAATLAVVLALPATALGQQARPQAETREQRLAQGWSALAAGRASQATTIANALLKASPRDHDAAGLAIAAGAAVSAVASLDAYEHWLAATGHEDPHLLATVAVAYLREFSRGPDAAAKWAALGALARAGDAGAQAAIDNAATSGEHNIEADAALAGAGNTAALNRLKARFTERADASPVIDALEGTGRANVAATIAEGLKSPAPPTRRRAAESLADLRATEMMPALRAALDAEQDPPTRYAIRVALGRLGDPVGRDDVAKLATHASGAMRLVAARDAAARDPHGSWAAAVEGLLKDPDPGVRIDAAVLLLQFGRSVQTAESALNELLADRSGPGRWMAARSLGRIAADHPVMARRLLRDSLAEVRLEAAKSLLLR